MRRKPGIFVLGTLCLCLSGCELFFNALFGSALPVSVSASDGDYANTIEVTWGAPSPSGDYEVDHYELSWENTVTHGTGSGSTTSTSYSIPIDDSNRFQEYSITVETFLRSKSSGGTTTGGSSSDTGFALLTSDLSWRTVQDVTSVAGPGNDYWYVTLLQKGFTYHFVFPNNSATVNIYHYHSIDDPAQAIGTGSGPYHYSWICNSDGENNKFFIHVIRDPSDSYFNRYFSFPQ